MDRIWVEFGLGFRVVVLLPGSASACLHCSCYYSSFAGIKPALVAVNHRPSSPVIATLTPPSPSSSRNPNRGHRSGSNVAAKVLSPAPFDNATTGLHRCRRRCCTVALLLLPVLRFLPRRRRLCCARSRGSPPRRSSTVAAYCSPSLARSLARLARLGFRAWWGKTGKTEHGEEGKVGK